tara:strand:- start:29290 stop:30189 length:900 start_codon:yes stop_codon:yes gene_type:complete
MNKSELKVSIVMPSYNHGHFIDKAIDSVINQSFKDWEIVVIDNNSKDNTHEVLSRYKDINLRILNIDNKGIIAASRNLGITNSESDYIAFLDSDDLWYPNKLKVCLDLLEKGYDMVCHAEKWTGLGKEKNVIYGPEHKASYDSLLFSGNCISTSAVVLKKEVLTLVNGFSEESEFVTAEDYDLWLRISKENKKIGFVNEVLGEYRIHDNNQSKIDYKNMNAITSVLKFHLKQNEEKGINNYLRSKNCLAKVIYGKGRELQKLGQFKKASLLFLRAITSFPLNIKFYIALISSSFGIKLI